MSYVQVVGKKNLKNQKNNRHGGAERGISNLKRGVKLIVSGDFWGETRFGNNFLNNYCFRTV